jgi:hypothetical protein
MTTTNVLTCDVCGQYKSTIHHYYGHDLCSMCLKNAILAYKYLVSGEVEPEMLAGMVRDVLRLRDVLEALK